MAKIWCFLKRRRTLHVLAWLVLLGTGPSMLYYSWHAMDEPGRPDGNDGHATIDFGGQWLMGRMFVEGQGKHLYDRDYQHEVLKAHYPKEDCEEGPDKQDDVENLMGWTMGKDTVLDDEGKHLGGPLYPPVHCFFMAPLALLPPHISYRVSQVLNMIEALLAGIAIRRLFGKRLWLPFATLMVLGYFGFTGSMTLGQNATLTLAILLWGWVFIVEDWPIMGGVIWGLLAFKPVWALSFFVVPVLTRRWRTCLAMALTGAGLVLLTLPVVGWHAWLDWFRIGLEAAELYKKETRWIPLSRDILGLPRRWFKGSDAPEWMAGRVGWAMLVFIFLSTVAVAFRRRRDAQMTAGLMPAFVLLAAWLCCFHFMYYDVLLSVLPLVVLLADTKIWLTPSLVVFRRFGWPARARKASDWMEYYALHPSAQPEDAGSRLAWSGPVPWVVNSLPATIILFLYLKYPIEMFLHWLHHSFPGQPLDTYCLIGIWMWCGIRLLLERPARFDRSTALISDAFPEQMAMPAN